MLSTNSNRLARFSTDHLLPGPVEETIESACITEQGRLEVTIDKKLLLFPVEWLRHNCECRFCFNPTTLSHVSLFESLAHNDHQLSSVQLSEDKYSVSCTWSDGHRSVYSSSWLYNRRFTREGAAERKLSIDSHKTEPWLNPRHMVVERETYDRVTETAEGFEKFGYSLIRDGIFIITDAPDQFVMKEFCESTGLVPTETHYGDVFTVVNQETPNNLAYTSKKLELHIDQPFLHHCPRIQLLHCLTPAAEGGENILSDGIKAALTLKQRFPHYYETLTKTLVEFEDVIALAGEKNHYFTRKVPVINLDADGRPEYIMWNNMVHSSYFDGTVELYEDWMAAFKEFYKILYEFGIKLMSEAGDILVFDNRRVMHARESYNTSCKRVLEGFYTDWDYVYSRLRVTKVLGSLN